MAAPISVIFDVIKRRDERRSGKETPKKEMNNRRIFMTSHMTLSSASELHKNYAFLHENVLHTLYFL